MSNKFPRLKIFNLPLKLWEFITRIFLTCDGNKCGGYTEPDLLFRIDEDGYIPMPLGGGYDIYVYYCPWCGRKLKRKKG